MELMTVLIPRPRYYNPDASGMRREVEDEKFIETANEIAAVFEGGGSIRKYDDDDKQRGFYVKFYGGGAGVTTRLITKGDRRDTAGGPT